MLRELELKLRRYGPAFPDFDTVCDWARKQSFEGAADWARAMQPLFSARCDDAPHPLALHIAAHLRLSEALARGTDTEGTGALWQAEAGVALKALMDELQAHADAAADMTANDYRAMFETLLQQRQLREAQIAHPNILIWGTIEARVQGCDLVILGGLNDAIWPKLPEPDPWLNRKMRKDAGLLLPDRQIGLAAHDYQQAIGAPRVVLTRAMRNSDSETIPSRWLNRLTNLMTGLPEKGGPQALSAMRDRGADWLRLAQQLDRPRAEAALQPNPRPAPAPPIAARPRELPVTAMEHLIANPYHIYAKYILGLRPLPPLRAQADARDRGTAVHQILERFVKTRPNDESRSAAYTRLLAIAETVFAQEVPFPAMRALWLAKLMYAADQFLTEDRKHGGSMLAIETKGRLELADVGFALTGTPDRIDRLPDGRLHLIDYKTGAPPTIKDQSEHRKQLLFAAVMAEKGGFAEIGPSDVAKITYLSLARDTASVDIDLDAARLTAEAQILHDLAAAYLREDTGYTARRALFKTDYDGDYDHLMRYGEWQTSDVAVHIPVGRDKGAE
jgi:RecB family exonuclease